MKFFLVVFAGIIFVLSALSGCEKETKSPPAKPKAPIAKKLEIKPEGIVLEPPGGEGYIYMPRGRRDPFMPLIAPPKRKKGEGIGEVPGTLESYDISDFTLLAIAKKGGRYYALLLAPDNRSFTVREGSIVGLHKGKIGKVMSDKVILVEYTEDYRGKLKPRQIVLDLHKGR